jgi:integrase
MSEDYGAPRVYSSLPKVDCPVPRNVVITEGELERILKAAPAHIKCWLMMCSDLAMRSGTAAAMAPRNYDADARTLTFRTKKGREMSLPVTDELDAILRPLANLDADTPFVCQLHPDGKILANSMRLTLKKLRRRLGINRRIVPHDLRRTTAVNVYNETRDLRIVQAVLGHRDLDSTFRYLDHRNTPVMVSTLEKAKQHTEVIQ